MNKDTEKEEQAARKAVIQYIEESIRQQRYTTSYPVQKPINLKGEYLETICPSTLNVELWKAATYFITHSIITQQSKEKYLAGSNIYIALNSRELQYVIGLKYKIVVDNLIEQKIIECDSNYVPGMHSRRYKLCKKYRLKGYEFKQITHKPIVNGIRKRNIARLEKQRAKLIPLAHLVRWIINGKLSIDKAGALEYLQDEFKRRLERELGKRKLKPQHSGNIESIVLNRFTSAERQVINFDNINLFVDDAGGRLYSNITSLMSPLRDFLTYNGEKLVSIDLKNSQPLHFMVIMEKEFWLSEGKRKDITLMNLNRELYEVIREQSSTSSPYMMFNKMRVALRNQGIQDWYKTVVAAGKLYEFTSSKFSGKLITDGIDRFDSRTKAKREFLKLMYFDNTKLHSPSQQSFNLFKELFPLESIIMETLKSRNYRDFPVLLQKIEAHILLHIVCKEVFEHNPHIPLFTIHDSILTTKAYEETVLKIMEDVYEKIIGFVPKMELVDLTPINALSGVIKYVRDKIDQAHIEIADTLEEEDIAKSDEILHLMLRKKNPFPNIEAEIRLIVKPSDGVLADEGVLAMFGITSVIDFSIPHEENIPYKRKLKK